VKGYGQILYAQIHLNPTIHDADPAEAVSTNQNMPRGDSRIKADSN
jgi:hypothetical protein